MIEDYTSSFSFPDVQFSSNFVEIKVNGNFFNEVDGGTEEITLYSFVDLNETTSININIITHLIHSRISHLVKNGDDFNTAKQKAYHELLKIFYIDGVDNMNAGELDLTKDNFNDMNTYPTIFDNIFPDTYNGAKNIIGEQDTLFISKQDKYGIII